MAATLPNANQAHQLALAAQSNIQDSAIFNAVVQPILYAISNGQFSTVLNLGGYPPSQITRVIAHLTGLAQPYGVTQDPTGTLLTVTW
jgi:hypothetical protein